jgi:hypothetical protein
MLAPSLYCQIDALVTDLSKKTLRTNIAELNQLVGLYGQGRKKCLDRGPASTFLPPPIRCSNLTIPSRSALCPHVRRC